MGIAYHLTGEYDKAVEILEKGRDRNPGSHLPHLRLAALYAEMDRMEEARAAAEVLRIDPKFTVSIIFFHLPHSAFRILTASDLCHLFSVLSAST